MRILGVTGGTASGKSSVCEILKKHGGKIIDADRIARDLQKKGGVAYTEVVEYFGSDILLGNGELDRKKIADIVFADKKELLMLNRIVHKHVSKEIKRLVEEYRKTDCSFVVLDVPIPVEDGFFDTAETIWAVVANVDVRIERLMARMGIEENEALKRINSQMSSREYEDIADVVIANEGSYEELEKLVVFELNRFLAHLS